MKKKIFAILVAAILVLSVFAVGVFADDEGTPVLLGAGNDTESDDLLGAEKDGEMSILGAEENSDAKDVEATEEASETPVTTTGETTEEKTNWVENHKSLFIALIIVAAIALIVFILYLVSPKFREKFKKFWKDFNAEFKKLVWPTKKQLVRNSAVVLVTIVIAGAFLALLDLGFHKGMYALKDLVEYIWPVQ